MKTPKLMLKTLASFRHKLNARKIALVAVLLVSALNFLIFSSSQAFVFDEEGINGSAIASGVLDMALRATNFTPATAILAGEDMQRSVFVQNLGSLPFQHSQEYQYGSGNIDLCSALQLNVDYQYYDTGGVLQTVNKYSGSLASFSLNTSGADADFDHPNTHGYFANSDYADNEQWLIYTVSLPGGADPGLQAKTCSFNLVARAWQTDFPAYPQGFYDEEILSNTVNSGRWYLDPPVNEGWNLQTESPQPNSQPLNLACGAITDGGDPTNPRVAHNWSAVPFATRYQREVTYPSGAVSDSFYEPNNYTPFSSFGSPSGIEGLWRTRVLAFIDNNNSGAADAGDVISDWSDYCDITLDKTPPVTLATVTNSPTKPVEERLVNGGFEDGLVGWDKEVSSQAEVINSDSYTSPHEGGKMLKLGRDEDPGNEVTVNIVSQTIPQGIRSVGFYYNFFTKDTMGFDEPGMMVYVNDKQVQQIWASDVNETDQVGSVHSTGWKHMNVYVGDLEEATLTIAFYAGNGPGDTQNQSWLYVDDVSTMDLIVNDKAKFDLKVTGTQLAPVKTFYKIGIDGETTEGTSFSLTGQPSGGIITYWSEDAVGNKESPHVVLVGFDSSQPSQISDLTANDEGDGEYLLQFTSPSDDTMASVDEYDIRYSTTPITNSTDWSTLSKPQRGNQNDGLPGEIRAPRLSGQPEAIVLTGLIAHQEYYFAIKSADAAKNWSEMSNLVHVNSPIVLNEILYDPVGDDEGNMPAGEWVELYNNSDADIDVSGWYLQDAANHKIIISVANSDSNLNLTDGGETIVPTQGRLVVYRNGNAVFNNTGDTVSLYKPDHALADSRTYTGGKTEGLSEARVPDGVGVWIDPIATPGTPNAQTVEDLQPQAKLWQQDTYNTWFTIFDSQAYTTAEYIVTYTHVFEGADVQEAVKDSVEIDDQSRINVSNVYFATCSEGGVVCVPHMGVKEVGLEVKLTKTDGTTTVLKYDYPDTWNSEIITEL